MSAGAASGKEASRTQAASMEGSPALLPRAIAEITSRIRHLSRYTARGAASAENARDASTRGWSRVRWDASLYIT